MPAAPRIAPATLFTPQEWRPFQSRSAWVGPLLVLHCWAVIALAVTAGVAFAVWRLTRFVRQRRAQAAQDAERAHP